MSARLFNKAMGLPAGAVSPFVGKFQMRYSNHAKEAAMNDRYGMMELRGEEIIAAAEVIEVEIVDGRAAKAVVRMAYDETVDIILVVNRPENGVAFVRTVWFNAANDGHGTLKRELINRPTASELAQQNY